jgi:hypothetical protein
LKIKIWKKKKKKLVRDVSERWTKIELSSKETEVITRVFSCKERGKGSLKN